MPPIILHLCYQFLFSSFLFDVGRCEIFLEGFVREAIQTGIAFQEKTAAILHHAQKLVWLYACVYI